MIESIGRGTAPVLSIRRKNTKSLRNSTVTKSQADGVSTEIPTVSPSKHSVQKPPAINTQQDKPDASLEDLLRQGHFNSSSTDRVANTELIEGIEKAIKRIKSSDNALLGVDEIIEEIKTSAQFTSGDIRGVAENMKDQNMRLEIGLYSLSRIMEDARKALRGGQREGTATASEMQNIVANITEHLTNLMEEINTKQHVNAYEIKGTFARLMAHMAETRRLQEEKNITKRKEYLKALSHPEKSKSQYDSGMNHMKEYLEMIRETKNNNSAEETIAKIMQPQQQRVAAVANTYKKVVADTLKDATAKEPRQSVLA